MRTLKISMLLLAAGIVFQACDKLDAPYATVKDITSDTLHRTIVLEDYTGHTCVNCPGAAKTAHALEEAYPGEVFVIAVHAGYYARPDSSAGSLYKADFRCQTGNDWNLTPAFKIDQNPKGMINRVPYKGDMSMLPANWPGAVAEMAKKPKAAVMSMQNTYDAGTRMLTTRVDIRFLIKEAGTYNLVVCILEDSIYGAQKNNDPKVDSVPEIKKFLFMDVLRGSMNGSWGEELTSATDTTTILTKSYTFPLNATWVAKNCKVVAFVANAESYEILHAKAQKIPAVK